MSPQFAHRLRATRGSVAPAFGSGAGAFARRSPGQGSIGRARPSSPSSDHPPRAAPRGFPCSGRIRGFRTSGGDQGSSLGAAPSWEGCKFRGVSASSRECAPARGETGAKRPMPAIAHMICQSCGAHSEGLASRNGSSATGCPCGGSRQVVRIARHPWGVSSASPEELERSVQERADDETLTPTPQGKPLSETPFE
jgi:hypothetical protein